MITCPVYTNPFLLTSSFLITRGASLESKILRDRLYRSRESPGCLAALGSAPEFPFSVVQVNKAPAGYSSASSQGTRQRQQQGYQHQHQVASQKDAVSHIPTAHTSAQQTQPVRTQDYFLRSFFLIALDLTRFYVLILTRLQRAKSFLPDGLRYRTLQVVRPIMRTKTLVRQHGKGRSHRQLLLRRLLMYQLPRPATRQLNSSRRRRFKLNSNSLSNNIPPMEVRGAQHHPGLLRSTVMGL